MTYVTVKYQLIEQMKDLIPTSDMYQKHSCIICKHGKIMAKDVNKIRGNISFHAEVETILQFLKNKNINLTYNEISKLQNNILLDKNKLLQIKAVTKNINIYVIRKTESSDTLKDSKPCFFCSNFIRNTGIKNVYYSCTGGFFVTEKGSCLNSTFLSQSAKFYID